MATLPENPVGQRARRPSRTQALWAAVGLAAIAGVVGISVLVSAWSAGPRTNVLASPVAVAGLLGTQEFSVEISPRAVPPVVDVRDGTGRLLATIETGYSPEVVYRRASGELIVSSLRDSNGGAVATAEFLDVRNGFRVSRTMTVPDRKGYHIYFPTLVLSGDESRLAFMTRDLRDSPECRPGRPIKAEVCDAFAVTVVDLADLRLVGSATLSQGCGVPGLAPGPGASVTATCSSSAVLVEIDGGARIVRTVDLRGLVGNDEDPVLSRNPVTAVAGFLDADGTVRMIFADGRMANSSTGSISRIVPSGKRVDNSGRSIQRLPSGSLLIPFKTAYYSGEADGYAVVAPNGTILGLHEVPGLRAVSSIGPSGFTAITADGRLLTSGGTETSGRRETEVVLGYSR